MAVLIIIVILFRLLLLFPFSFLSFKLLGYNILLYFFIAFIIMLGYGVITAGKYVYMYMHVYGRMCTCVGVFLQLYV